MLASATDDDATCCDVVAINPDVLVYEQLDVFMGRQVHRHLIVCIPKCALNSVFYSTLMEAIELVLLRDRSTHVITGNTTTLMARNLSVKNQNELEN